MRKLDSFYRIVQSWSIKRLHSLNRVVFLATMYVYQRMWTPFIVENTTTISDWDKRVIAMRNTDVNVHTAHCAALALRGVPHVIYLILCHFSNFASKFMQMLFLI